MSRARVTVRYDRIDDVWRSRFTGTARESTRTAPHRAASRCMPATEARVRERLDEIVIRRCLLYYGMSDARRRIRLTLLLGGALRCGGLGRRTGRIGRRPYIRVDCVYCINCIGLTRRSILLPSDFGSPRESGHNRGTPINYADVPLYDVSNSRSSR